MTSTRTRNRRLAASAVAHWVVAGPWFERYLADLRRGRNAEEHAPEPEVVVRDEEDHEHDERERSLPVAHLEDSREVEHEKRASQPRCCRSGGRLLPRAPRPEEAGS